MYFNHSTYIIIMLYLLFIIFSYPFGWFIRFILNFWYAPPQKLKLNQFFRKMMYYSCLVLVVLLSHHSLGLVLFSSFSSSFFFFICPRQMNIVYSCFAIENYNICLIIAVAVLIWRNVKLNFWYDCWLQNLVLPYSVGGTTSSRAREQSAAM